MTAMTYQRATTILADATVGSRNRAYWRAYWTDRLEEATREADVSDELNRLWTTALELVAAGYGMRVVRRTTPATEPTI